MGLCLLRCLCCLLACALFKGIWNGCHIYTCPAFGFTERSSDIDELNSNGCTHSIPSRIHNPKIPFHVIALQLQRLWICSEEVIVNESEDIIGYRIETLGACASQCLTE